MTYSKLQADIFLVKVDKFISALGLKVKEYEELELNKANIKDYSGIVVLKYD